MNKPEKDFLKSRFGEWYSGEVMKQLDKNVSEGADWKPINLGLPVLKELGAKWLVQMAEHFQENPQIIVNGFLRAGIAAGLDRASRDLEGEEDTSSETESDFGVSEEEGHTDVVEISDD